MKSTLHNDPPDMPADKCMTGIALKTTREWLGLSGQWLADHLDVNPRTIRSWEQGRDPIPDGVRLEVERLEEQSGEIVDRLVEALSGMRDPLVRTYQTDEQYREYEPGQPWPAAWHRRVVARAAQEVPGLVIAEPEAGL